MEQLFFTAILIIGTADLNLSLMLTRRSLSLLRPQARWSSTLTRSSALESRETFEAEIANNPILHKLWHAPHTHLKPEEDTVNASSTLPIILRSKSSVFADVAKSHEGEAGFGLKWKQYKAYFLSVIHFYRVGIQNVWRNRRVMNEIKNKYYIESVATRGEVAKRKVKNGQDLVQALSSLQSLERIEQEAVKNSDSSVILNITRKEFQTILRTERDFFKVPMFAVILVIFAEMTPIVCTLVPEIAPSTCVFPGLLKKIYKSPMEAQDTLTTHRKEHSLSTYSSGVVPFQPLPKLTTEDLRLLAKSLNLTSRYIPISLYPETILQTRLTHKFHEIKVDNHFLINSSQNLWNLNKNELIRCCVDRNLINLVTEDLATIGAHDLRIRLFFFLGLMESDKSPTNFGLLGLNHLGIKEWVEFTNIDNKTAHLINGWWVQKHSPEKKDY